MPIYCSTCNKHWHPSCYPKKFDPPSISLPCFICLEALSSSSLSSTSSKPHTPYITALPSSSSHSFDTFTPEDTVNPDDAPGGRKCVSAWVSGSTSSASLLSKSISIDYIDRSDSSVVKDKDPDHDGLTLPKKEKEKEKIKSFAKTDIGQDHPLHKGKGKGKFKLTDQ